MDIFISYSTPDLQLVRDLADRLKPYANVYFWDDSKFLGQSAWEQVFQWIDISDLVVVLITGNTVSRAMSVGQEVGRAKAKDKTIVPIVSKEVLTNELGFLTGITFQPIDIANPAPALEAINKVANLYKEDLEKKKSLGILLLTVGIIVWLFSKAK